MKIGRFTKRRRDPESRLRQLRIRREIGMCTRIWVAELMIGGCSFAAGVLVILLDVNLVGAAIATFNFLLGLQRGSSGWRNWRLWRKSRDYREAKSGLIEAAQRRHLPGEKVEFVSWFADYTVRDGPRDKVTEVTEVTAQNIFNVQAPGDDLEATIFLVSADPRTPVHRLTILCDVTAVTPLDEDHISVEFSIDYNPDTLPPGTLAQRWETGESTASTAEIWRLRQALNYAGAPQLEP